VSEAWTIPVSLLAILGSSTFMLMQLLRRHTVGRERFVKWEWSVNRGFRTGELGAVQIEGLEEIQGQSLRAIEHYRSRAENVSILRLHTIGTDDVVRTWHLLVQTVDAYSTPIALRPVGATSSIVDLMNLTLFPKLSGAVRFAVYGLRAIDARKLVTSHALALLPPDIGLIRNADQLILDFTARPFDTVEFSRALAIAEQLKKVI
jgi:hypothetical protein